MLHRMAEAPQMARHHHGRARGHSTGGLVTDSEVTGCPKIRHHNPGSTAPLQLVAEGAAFKTLSLYVEVIPKVCNIENSPNGAVDASGSILHQDYSIIRSSTKTKCCFVQVNFSGSWSP
jgi:hypothetical protein